jgi:hypothetical protein
MARITFTVTEEMYTALLAEAEKRGTPYALLAREYIARGLETDGHHIERKKVTWGGKRRPSKPDEPSGT